MPEPEAPPNAIFPGRHGYDKLTDPHMLTPGASNDMENVWPRPWGAAKRPGMTLLHADAMAGELYDMVRHAMISTDGTPVRVPDSLYCLFRDSGDSYKSHLAVLDPVNGTFTDEGIVNTGTDVYHDGELTPAGKDLIHISGFRSGSGTNGRMIEYTSGGGYAIAANNPQQAYRVMLWFREHLSGCWASDLEHLHEHGWAAYNNPRSFPAANIAEHRPLGRVDELNGAISANDIAYYLKSRSIWALTGAVDDIWEMQRISSEFGGFTGRACCDANGTIYGLAVEPGWMDDGTDQNERTYPTNIFRIKEFDVTAVGEKIRPDLDALHAAQIVTDAVDVKNRKAAYWGNERMALFFPKIPFAAATASTAYVYYEPEQTFWKWTFSKVTRPNAPVSHNRTVYIGCGDGRVRYLDATKANDGTATFASSITSGPLFGPRRDHVYSMEGVIAAGGTTSGTEPVLWVQREEGAWLSIGNIDNAAGELIQCAGRVEKPGRYFRVRVVFHTDSVGAYCRWYLPVLKPMGRPQPT